MSCISFLVDYTDVQSQSEVHCGKSTFWGSFCRMLRGIYLHSEVHYVVNPLSVLHWAVYSHSAIHCEEQSYSEVHYAVNPHSEAHSVVY